ncbi:MULTISPECIES: hypothetical protein [Planktothrix]|uniref:hypothetical protein n=1 Tax=Planktothrix TaxID=54304 RepID=UPI00047D000E|nr:MULTISPECIES: hypothetical protein [Planktothrix]CAD0230024.1 hypothetical protein PL10110_480038 [Planktothrix agardhii]CAD5958192.1 hypothetical protein NO758_02972 [Planktothrix agardhii]
MKKVFSLLLSSCLISSVIGGSLCLAQNSRIKDGIPSNNDGFITLNLQRVTIKKGQTQELSGHQSSNSIQPVFIHLNEGDTVSLTPVFIQVPVRGVNDPIVYFTLRDDQSRVVKNIFGYLGTTSLNYSASKTGNYILEMASPSEFKYLYRVEIN